MTLVTNARWSSFLLPALLGLILAAPAPASAQQAGLGAAGELVDPDVLRVCADPSSMPFSNRNGDGFENRLAQLVAEKTGRKTVAYTWYPQATGFVRRTLRANLCDIIIGYAQGDELIQNTNAYYTSAYVAVYRRNQGLDGLESVTDKRLVGKKIGLVAGTPPATAIARSGLTPRVISYPLMVDTRTTPSQAEVMLKDLMAGNIDIALLWGPMAGYYADRIVPDAVIVPLVKETGLRMVFRITMGVRPSDQEWKRTLNQVIKDNQPEIDRILHEYHVPLVEESKF